MTTDDFIRLLAAMIEADLPALPERLRDRARAYCLDEAHRLLVREPVMRVLNRLHGDHYPDPDQPSGPTGAPVPWAWSPDHPYASKPLQPARVKYPAASREEGNP